MKSGKKMYWNTSNPLTGHLLFFLYIYLCLSHGTIDFAYLISSNISPSYLISGHRWTIIVNIFCPEPHFSHHSSQSLPKSPNSIPPFLLVSSQNTVAAEAILTYFCTITPSGCPSAAPFFFFYFVSHRQPASLCRCSEVCEEETLMGEVSVPLCLNAWEVTYLGAEKERERERERRRDGGGAVEYQFCSSLLGQKHLLYRKGKKVINKRGMFTSFSIFFSFHHTAVAESMWMFSRFIAKSIPVHGSHSVTPNRKMRVHQQGPFPPPRLPRLALHQNLPCASIFFLYSRKKKWRLKRWMFTALLLLLYDLMGCTFRIQSVPYPIKYLF